MVPTDTIIFSMVNGSPDYIEWVHEQTMKKGKDFVWQNI